MVVVNEQAQLRKVLSDAIPLLCRSTLGLFDSSFSVEVIVGVTVSEADVLVVSFKETVLPDGSTISYGWQKVDENIEPLDEVCVIDIKNESAKEDDVGTSEESAFYRPMDHRSEEMFMSSATGDDRDCEGNCIQDSQFRENTFSYDDNQQEECLYRSDAVCYDSDISTGYARDGSKFDAVCWRSARKNCSTFGEMENLDSTVVKVEKQNVVKVEKQDVGEGNFVSDDGALNDDPGRRGRNGTAAMLERRGMNRAKTASRLNSPFAKRQMQSTKQNNSTSRYRSLNQHHRHQPPAASASESRFKNSYKEVIDRMCQNVVQQSTSRDGKQYECHICHATLANTNNLMAHIQGTHLALERYQCGLCSERFRWYMQLHRHRKRHHPEMLA